MKDSHFSRVLVGIGDFMVAALVFWQFSRTGGVFEDWRMMCALSAVWVLTGILTSKLTFDRYRKVEFAVVSIIYIDIIAYLLIYYITRIKGLGISGPDVSIWGLPVIILGELALFFLFAGYIIRRLPAYYEPEFRQEDGSDKNISLGAKLYSTPSVSEKTPRIPDETFAKLKLLHEQIVAKPWKEVESWMEETADELGRYALVLPTNDVAAAVAAVAARNRQTPAATPTGSATATEAPAASDIVICTERLNNARQLNRFLEKVNEILPDGGAILVHATTSAARRDYILKSSPVVINRILWGLDFIWSRVMPKLTVTRPFYFAVTDGKTRNLPRVEILGRLSRAGFNIVNEEQYLGEYYVTGLKVSAPHNGQKPNYGPVIKLRRVGKDGQMINVFKLRSMYSYSEYIQSYAYGILGLQEGGKLKDDFRVTPYGRFIRSCWIDELPMLVNLLRGDLKLVGVRPLSRQYFSLYTPGMQELRTTVKPGLIPPFYAGKVRPVTIEDVQESERRYIEAWHKAHLKTDLSYLWNAFVNIVFKHSRSH